MVLKNIMKKLLISFLVCAMFLTFTSSVKAYSIDDLMSQLTSLQQQVNSLQSQLGAAAVTALNTNTAVACLPTTTPWIKVVSPNGGETYTPGQQIRVTWLSCNISSSALVLVHLDYAPGQVLYNMLGSYNATTVNSGSVSITLPLTTVWPGSPNSVSWGNNYKIFITLATPGGSTDYSDNLFAINSSSNNLPIGCTSAIGYSTTTGLSCGCNGTVYSTYNGQLCPTIINDSSSTLKSKAPSVVAQKVASQNASFKRTLKVGIKGDDVAELQKVLITKGFLSIGNNSGYYGLLTKAAVMKYQTSIGLQSDGKAGLKTLEKINIESI